MTLIRTPSKSRVSGSALAGATLVCALGVGYVMQYGFALPGAKSARFDGSGRFAPVGMARAPEPSRLDDLPEIDASEAPPAYVATEDDTIVTGAPEAMTESVAANSCAISMTADPTAGALVKVALDAPCNANERVTLHHNGLMFTEVTDAEGQLDVSVPALSERALFMVSFSSGPSTSALAEVPSLPFYDRVAVQWKGATGLQLHAREFTKDYFSEGHVWSEGPGDVSAAARGEGGFLTRLGNSDAPDALTAEVYSFPVGTAQRSGEILLTVEAEVTDANCASQVDAQTLEKHESVPLQTRNLTLEMPGCEATGDVLVLKNLVKDLTIASR
jgi:hypothetical protein